MTMTLFLRYELSIFMRCLPGNGEYLSAAAAASQPTNYILHFLTVLSIDSKAIIKFVYISSVERQQHPTL